MFGSFAGLGEALPGSVLIKTEAYGRKWIVFVWFSISNWVEYGSVLVERANRLETIDNYIWYPKKTPQNSKSTKIIDLWCFWTLYRCLVTV